MNTDDLREQFSIENPKIKADRCITHEDLNCDYFTDDYVLWLEKMILNTVNRYWMIPKVEGYELTQLKVKPINKPHE